MTLFEFIAREVLLFAFAVAMLSNDASLKRTASVVAGVAAVALAVLLLI